MSAQSHREMAERILLEIKGGSGPVAQQRAQEAQAHALLAIAIELRDLTVNKGKGWPS